MTLTISPKRSTMIVNEADLVFFGKLCFGQNVWSSYAFLMFACNYPKQLTYLKNVFEEKMLGITIDNNGRFC